MKQVFSLSLALMALSACVTPSLSPSSQVEAAAQRSAYAQAAETPVVEGIIASGDVAILKQLQPGATPAQSSARELSLALPSSCGSFASACSFVDGGTPIECSWFGDGRTQRVLECQFDALDGSRKSLTFLPNGQYTQDLATVSASALIDPQAGGQSAFRAGIWYQTDAQARARQSVWEEMVRIYTAQKGAQLSRQAAEQRRANQQLTADATALLTGIAAGLSTPTTGGQSTGLRPGCDCPTGNTNDCSDELSGLQPIEEYCR
ncbi:hypothetical protein [Dinoroseobacter sp. S76]|uniref:hypothetical protein n=1 Tax=Dinoroseobacter sp. S76 TaxID=3415124 RepID=UPI003C7ECEB6